MGGMQDIEGDFEYNYRILNDLSNTEYIEIIKAKGNEPVIAEGSGYILKCSYSNGEKADLINEVISRKPNKKELKDVSAFEEKIVSVRKKIWM